MSNGIIGVTKHHLSTSRPVRGRKVMLSSSIESKTDFCSGRVVWIGSCGIMLDTYPNAYFHQDNWFWEYDDE